MGSFAMWAVGPNDGEGWIAVRAPDEAAARLAFAEENDDGGISDSIVAVRAPSWDSLTATPTGADWLNAGLSYTCDRGCGCMACFDDGGAIINGEPVCGYCIEHNAAPNPALEEK